MTPTERASRPPVPALIVLISLPLLLIIGVLVMAALATREANDAATEPLSLTPIDSPQAGSNRCNALLAALPQRLDTFGRVDLIDPAPAGAAAWRDADGRALILRCGLISPPADTITAQPVSVSGVRWAQGPALAPQRAETTWLTLDREVGVGVTLPDGSGPTPMQLLSEVIAATVPAN